MEEFDTRVYINRPVGEVFARWADLGRAPEWAAAVIERRKLTEGPVGVGTKYRAVDQFLGRRIEFTLEITEYEPDRLMAGAWSGARHVPEQCFVSALPAELVETVLKLRESVQQVALIRVVPRDCDVVDCGVDTG